MVNPKKTTFSPEQLKILAITPKFSASLSIIGSAWIIFEVLRDRRKQSLVYHRLMLEMSLFCLIVNFTAHFLSTWPIPSDTPNVYGASGSTASCMAQGFFFQLALPGAIVSQAFLAAYHLLVLRHNWRETRLRNLEKASFGFCGLLGLGTAVAGLPLNLFNSANFWCWIAPYPAGCKGSSCTRGINAAIYRYAFYYAWSWLALLVVVVVMCVLYYTVHQQVERAKKYSTRGFLERKKGQIAIQAIYYILAFLSVSLFASLGRIIQQTTGNTYFSVALLKMIFTPLRGFWNGLIYLYPRYRSYREEHPDWKPWHVLRQVLLKPVQGRRGSLMDHNDEDHKLGHIESDEPEPISTDSFFGNSTRIHWEDKKLSDKNLGEGYEEHNASNIDLKAIEMNSAARGIGNNEKAAIKDKQFFLRSDKEREIVNMSQEEAGLTSSATCLGNDKNGEDQGDEQSDVKRHGNRELSSRVIESEECEPIVSSPDSDS